MRKPQTSLYLILALCVFLISFFIGRATALKDSEESKKNAVYTGRILLPEKEKESVPAGTVEEKIEVLDEFAEKSEEQTEEKKQAEEKKQSEKITISEEKEDSPPERMLFPCGQVVLNDYSQTVVYSKTMDDWRAHTAIDYKAEKGTVVVSAWDGIVRRVFKDNYWGYCIEITHPGEIVSVYKNLDEKISVKEGEKVSKGQAIAFVGDSAVLERREEPHLHFELLVAGVPINPESYVY